MEGIMRIKKLEHILNRGSFHSDVSPDVALALKATLERNYVKSMKNVATVEPFLDFTEINKEAIKFAGAGVRYPENLPKGVIISVRKELKSSVVR